MITVCIADAGRRLLAIILTFTSRLLAYWRHKMQPAIDYIVLGTPAFLIERWVRQEYLSLMLRIHGQDAVPTVNALARWRAADFAARYGRHPYPRDSKLVSALQEAGATRSEIWILLATRVVRTDSSGHIRCAAMTSLDSRLRAIASVSCALGMFYLVLLFTARTGDALLLHLYKFPLIAAPLFYAGRAWDLYLRHSHETLTSWRFAIERISSQ